MLTLPYLQGILRGKIIAIADTSSQIIESAGGYDGIVSLIQTKGISPMVILEHSDIGELSFRPGGFNKTSQSIWVMKMVGRDNDRRVIQNQCFDMVKRILSILSAHEHDDELEGWEYDRIPYGVRNAGANFTGYELTLYFSEDTDLSYHG